jgi:hypothetical protein
VNTKCILLILLIASAGNSQVLAPELSSGAFEMGYMYKWFHRDMFQIYHWSIASIYARYGVGNCLTLSAEGLISNFTDSKFPDRDYRGYVVGCGATMHVLTLGSFRFAVSFHYNERFSFDRSESRYHKDTRGVLVFLQSERSFFFRRGELVIWLGPAFVYDEFLQNVYGYYDPVHDKTHNNLGFICGLNIVLLRYVDMFTHVVYADYLQPRVGVGIRL